jgi:hypothetical protein
LRGEDGFEGGEEGVGFPGLLDTGFEKIGWLEENGGGEARAEACGEVEDCFRCCEVNKRG